MSDTSSRVGRSRVRGIARHGRLRKAGPVGAIFSVLATTIVVVLVAGIGVAAVATIQLQTSVKTIDIHPGQTPAPPPGIGVYPGGFNILVVGDDTRAGQGGIGAGLNDTGTLNDVNILLHVSGDHTNAIAVSIPRDMVVPMPACTHAAASIGVPINTALSRGGLACAVATVENLTGLPIQFAGLITFRGVIEMSNAVGGVRVCVSGNINDREVGLHLKSGYHVLRGETALKFLRSRHGVGDGSDLGRISSQQVYLSALVRKLQNSGTLSNPATVYKIASAAIHNMELSTSMKNLDTLYSIAQALKGIPLSRVTFIQYPGTTNGVGIFAGKVQPIISQANLLFGLIKRDKAVGIGVQAGNRGSVADPNKPSSTSTSTPSATSTPNPTTTTKPGKVTVLDGFAGQTADQQTCSKANAFNGEG